MGLFTNPLGHAGYPPAATAPATVVNSTVRAATSTEASAGTLTGVYISPATMGSVDAAIFAVPPALGSTTPNVVSSTTLNSTGNTLLATAVTATSVNIANAANTSALVVNIANGASAANSTVNVLSGSATAGVQTFNVGNGAGSATISLGATGGGGNNINIGSASAGNNIKIGSATSSLGFYGVSVKAQQVVDAVTNSVTVGGTSGTIADYSDLTVYANDAAAIRNDIYQLARSVAQLTVAVRNLGLGA